MEQPRFGHVGIAVDDLEAARDGLARVLGLAFGPVEQVEAQQVRVCFAAAAGIELVQATSEHNPALPIMPHPIASFLGRHGQGLHHLSFAVPDVAAAIETLHARGVRTLTDEPQPGAHGARVVFLHPDDCEGILIELCEESDATRRT